MLMNVMNENKEGCDVVVGEDSCGLFVIVSLIFWLVLLIEGFMFRDVKECKRIRTSTDDFGLLFLNVVLVLFVNIVEVDVMMVDVLCNVMVCLLGDLF